MYYCTLVYKTRILGLSFFISFFVISKSIKLNYSNFFLLCLPPVGIYLDQVIDRTIKVEITNLYI